MSLARWLGCRSPTAPDAGPGGGFPNSEAPTESARVTPVGGPRSHAFPLTGPTTPAHPVPDAATLTPEGTPTMWPRTRPGLMSVRNPRRPTGSERRAASAAGSRLGLLEDRSLPSFLGPVDYAADSNPQATATGLFNNDTIPDLVVANYSSGTVSVLLGERERDVSARRQLPGRGESHVRRGRRLQRRRQDGPGDRQPRGRERPPGERGRHLPGPGRHRRGRQPVVRGRRRFQCRRHDGPRGGEQYLLPGAWGYYGWYPGYYVGHASVLIGTGTGSFGPDDNLAQHRLPLGGGRQGP